MYQFYYSQKSNTYPVPEFKLSVADRFTVTGIRPTVWEEHCLECSAPLCFEDCLNYAPRVDGRCKRFEDGIAVSDCDLGCGGQVAHVKFRKWANLMTVIYPSVLTPEQFKKSIAKNQTLGRGLGKLAYSKLPLSARWQSIRTVEYARRFMMKRSGETFVPDAFLFHGYSHYNSAFNLIVEVYDSDTPKFKTALHLEPGENLFILDQSKLSEDCWKAGYIVKVYPENNIEAELDILWCDFVTGAPVVQEKPADKVKCLVWDLDNTLWDGILIETEDPTKLELKPGVLETIKALDERGIVQSVASKNEYEDAWQVVKSFGLDEYFLYPQIHWNAKSLSLEQIAKDINIGIDTLALIDDSESERNQVSATLPQVRVYSDTELQDLLGKPEFEALVTEDSKARRKMYKAEERRNKLKSQSFADNESFLKQCNIVLTVFEPTTEEEKLRCFELLLRTNQLNMSGVKYTEEEFESVIAREDCYNISLSCKDDYGTYGVVGYLQYSVSGEELHFTEFAMSCRVAGKFVESALFAHLLKSTGCKVGHFAVNKTKKNTLLRQTLEDIGFKTITDSEDRVSYEVTAELKNKDIVKVKV